MEVREPLDELTFRLQTLLPEQYQKSFEELQPVSMGSAGLKYAPDGQVAWDEIWGSFCDLAMAGGPPHKGALLEPGSRADIDAHPDRYEEVVAELGRGITLATELPADRSPVPGWVRVTCYSDVMARWLCCAITMENISVQRDGLTLDLPAAPGFRVEKEIKNVITAIAKTCHYWLGHVPRTQKQSIAILFAAMDKESPLVEPDLRSEAAPHVEDEQLVARVSAGILRHTGLAAATPRYRGWLGIECPSVAAAMWLMRAVVTCNVLSRREGTTWFLPVNSQSDPNGESLLKAATRIHSLFKIAV